MTGDCQGHEQGNTEYFSPASNYSALTRNFFLKGCFQNEQPLALAYFAECEDIPDPGYLDNETQIPMGPLIFSLQATSILPCFASWCRYFTLQDTPSNFGRKVPSTPIGLLTHSSPLTAMPTPLKESPAPMGRPRALRLPMYTTGHEHRYPSRPTSH